MYLDHMSICLEHEVETALWLNTMHSLSLTSSFTSIYYAKQLKPSIRTQLPIRHFQDIIEF